MTSLSDQPIHFAIGCMPSRYLLASSMLVLIDFGWKLSTIFHKRIELVDSATHKSSRQKSISSSHAPFIMRFKVDSMVFQGVLELLLHLLQTFESMVLDSILEGGLRVQIVYVQTTPTSGHCQDDNFLLPCAHRQSHQEAGEEQFHLNLWICEILRRSSIFTCETFLNVGSEFRIIFPSIVNILPSKSSLFQVAYCTSSSFRSSIQSSIRGFFTSTSNGRRDRLDSIDSEESISSSSSLVGDDSSRA